MSVKEPGTLSEISQEDRLNIDCSSNSDAEENAQIENLMQRT